MNRQPCRRASIAPAWSMNERITPPKIVPCAFVSRGIMSTRIAGSFHFVLTSIRSGALLRLRLRLQHLVVDVHLRVLAKLLQQHGAQTARLLIANHFDV